MTSHSTTPCVDPEMRPYKEPMSAEMRERLIVGAAAGVVANLRLLRGGTSVGGRTARFSHHLPT